MNKFKLIGALSMLAVLAGCTGTNLHNKLGSSYPTYYETSPASAAYKPGRIYRTKNVQFLEAATGNGLKRIVFSRPCRPRVESERNVAFSETFTQTFDGRASGNAEIAGLASLSSDKDLAKLVHSVTMTIDATHLVIGAEEVSKAQAIARDNCPNTLKQGQMITQAIVADITVEVNFESGVNLTASTKARIARRITGKVGFGIQATRRTTTTAKGVIVAVKLEDANEEV